MKKIFASTVALLLLTSATYAAEYCDPSKMQCTCVKIPVKNEEGKVLYWNYDIRTCEVQASRDSKPSVWAKPNDPVDDDNGGDTGEDPVDDDDSNDDSDDDSNDDSDDDSNDDSDDNGGDTDDGPDSDDDGPDNIDDCDDDNGGSTGTSDDHNGDGSNDRSEDRNGGDSD